MRRIILYQTAPLPSTYYENIDVVTSLGSWEEVTDEEYEILKFYCSSNKSFGLRLAEQIDYASIVEKAKEAYAEEKEREKRFEKLEAKRQKQKAAAALKRKQKKLEALKKELGEDLVNHGKYTDPSNTQQP